MTRLVVILCALLLSGAAGATTAVWIDTDPAIGPPWREVDDAFALMLAFHSPELEIIGLSTTYGNAALPRTTTVARNLVRKFSASLSTNDVHPGARSRGDRGKRTDATEALAQALHQRRLTYLALGPLTNLAAFLRLHPTLAPRIERIVIVGGRSPDARFALGPNKSFRVHDANIFKDPAAAALVLRASRPLLLAPMELAPQLALTKADLRGLRHSGPSGDYLFRRTRVWRWFWTNIAREKGGLVFDVLAVLPVLHPSFLETETRFARLDTNHDLIAERARQPDGRRVQFGKRVDEGAKKVLLQRLAGESLIPARGATRPKPRATGPSRRSSAR